MTDLLDLPAEILNQICEQLCYYCRNPRHFVNAYEEESVEDKRVLAKLCRTSRILLNLGQPVLYHYYATGNLAPVVENGIERRSMPRRMPDDDKLALFLRTIIERPDLNQMVRSLQLVHDDQSPPITHELYTLLKRHEGILDAGCSNNGGYDDNGGDYDGDCGGSSSNGGIYRAELVWYLLP
ncbi:hypothetical protein COL922a_013041 [Colletotrichum nupharicola]|nr:hypothetical protein COL922a_013041 [Colletotrichum nupharicola]